MPAGAASRNNGHPPSGGAKKLERGYPLINAARRLYSPDLPALTWTLLMGVVEAVPPTTACSLLSGFISGYPRAFAFHLFLGLFGHIPIDDTYK
jgi:hypothetical protein